MTLLYFTQTGPPASGTRRKQNPERGNGRGRSRSEETRRVSTRAGRRVSPSRGRGGTRRASKSPGKRGHQSAGPPPPLVWRLVQKAQALMAKQTPCALGLSVGLAGPETLALPGRRLPVPACVCVEGDAPGTTSLPRTQTAAEDVLLQAVPSQTPGSTETWRETTLLSLTEGQPARGLLILKSWIGRQGVGQW